MEEIEKQLEGGGLTVRVLPDKGRSLFTTRHFNPGEVILCEEPYVCVPNKTLKELKCDWCFASGNVKRCSSCQLACYCGSSCQKSDWKLHRLECQALLRPDKDRLRALTPTMRMMVKLYLRRKLQSEKVLISYIETAGSTMTRQKALKEQYFFTCNCPRCIKVGQWEDIQESAILEGYRCEDDGCNGFLLRDPGNKSFSCQQCGHIRDKEELSKISGDIKLLSKKASVSHSSGYIKEACDSYLMVENLQVKICHPFSIILMQTRETLLKIFMELQDWNQALARCRLTIPVYESRLLGYSEDAMKSLGKAVDILRITHGTNSPFMKELLMKLDEARAEASYKLSYNDG